jgi:hypothetical protein
LVEYGLLEAVLGVAAFVIGLALFLSQVPSQALFFIGGILILVGILLLTPVLRDVLA